MKKNKHIALISTIVSILFTQNIFAMDILPVQSENSLLIKTANTERRIKGIPAYVYNGSNYFMLRDIGKLTGYRVEWDGTAKQIYLQKDLKARNFEELSKINNVTNAEYSNQTIFIDNVKHQDFACLNMDGYYYFKLRELSAIMDFSCDWNGETNTIIISDTIDAKLSQDTNDSKIKLFLDEDLKQIVIENDDTEYVKGSKDYSDIESYIKNHIDKTFKAMDYAITESDTYGKGIITLDLRMKVGDTDRSNFGYRIICFDDAVKIIGLIGEKSPNFDISKVRERNLSEHDIKNMAIELDGFKYAVDEQRITKFFDMKDLQFKYEVETVYIDEGGRYFATTHLL